MALTVLWLSGLIIERHSMEHLSPAILITPIGNMIAAMAFAELDSNHIEKAYFWCADKGEFSLARNPVAFNSL